MKLGFQMSFKNDCFNHYFNNIYFGCAYLNNGFLILDSDPNDLNNFSFSFVFNTSSAYVDDSKLWHAELSHIGQNHLA